MHVGDCHHHLSLLSVLLSLPAISSFLYFYFLLSRLQETQRHSENFLALPLVLRSQGVKSTKYGVGTPGYIGSWATDLTPLTSSRTRTGGL